MNFDEYQRLARKTAIYPEGFGLMYTTMGLAGEAGEVSDKMKKMLRDDDGVMTEERRVALIDELGDVLWYLANLSEELNVDFDYIATRNIEKLGLRQTVGTLQGDGDDR